MTIGMIVNYSLQLLGDGVSTTFALDFAASAILTGTAQGGPGGIVTGASLGSPQAIYAATFTGPGGSPESVTATLSGRVVTITFATAPTGLSDGLLQMVY